MQNFGEKPSWKTERDRDGRIIIRWVLEREAVRMGVAGTDSGQCPKVSFCIIGVEPWGSAITETNSLGTSFISQITFFLTQSCITS
jgi:hypothetical protein